MTPTLHIEKYVTALYLLRTLFLFCPNNKQCHPADHVQHVLEKVALEHSESQVVGAHAELAQLIADTNSQPNDETRQSFVGCDVRGAGALLPSVTPTSA